jgi:hypothetical protein
MIPAIIEAMKITEDEIRHAGESMEERTPGKLESYKNIYLDHAVNSFLKVVQERGVFSRRRPQVEIITTYSNVLGGFTAGEIEKHARGRWEALYIDRHEQIEGKIFPRRIYKSLGEETSKSQAAKLILQEYRRREAARYLWALRRLTDQRPEVLEAERALNKLSPPEARRLIDAYIAQLDKK